MTPPILTAARLHRHLFPGGFAAGLDGSLYVSDWSVLPAHGPAGAPTGSVVRITLGS